jgi:uncharacterized protein (DUF488 family)
VKIYTIGFTKTSAKHFFDRIKEAKVRQVVDVRLNNLSQLAGFAKRDDLRFFLDSISGVGYTHRTELAPTQDMLDAYKKHKGEWADNEQRFLHLMEERRIEETIPRESIDNACLLCSEDQPQHCHRRLVAEYLRKKWGDVEIVHL